MTLTLFTRLVFSSIRRKKERVRPDPVKGDRPIPLPRRSTEPYTIEILQSISANFSQASL